MGDEVRRTQGGNNNAYCETGDINYFDWTLLERHADVHRFVKLLNRFRRHRDAGPDGVTLSLNELLKRMRIQWHGTTLDQPDWNDNSHSLAYTIQSMGARFLLHVMLNAYWEPLSFELPPVPTGGQHVWRRCLDTALPSPADMTPWENAPAVSATSYRLEPRSIAVLAIGL